MLTPKDVPVRIMWGLVVVAALSSLAPRPADGHAWRFLGPEGASIASVAVTRNAVFAQDHGLLRVTDGRVDRVHVVWPPNRLMGLTASAGRDLGKRRVLALAWDPRGGGSLLAGTDGAGLAQLRAR